MLHRQNIITSEVLRLEIDIDDRCEGKTCSHLQGFFRIVASQLVDRWQGYALKFKPKDAVHFFVILSFDVFWQAVFSSETLWRCKK